VKVQVTGSRQALSDKLDDAAGHLNAQYGRLIDATVALLADPIAWQGDGVWTIEAYLAWRCGVSRSTADKIAAVARRADELPDALAAVRAGELSLDQADPIARRCPAWADAQVARLARKLTVTQIRRLVKKYPWPAAEAEADTADDRPSEPVREVQLEPAEPESPELPGGESVTPTDVCWYGCDDDGRWRMWVETDHETGMVIESGIDEARDALFLSGHTAVNGVDALRSIAERSVDSVSSRDRRDRYRMNIHLDRDGNCTDRLGRVLPDAVAKHLTCDGLVSPVFFDNGTAVSVGRSQYLVPERTRRVVEHRDGGCRVPGCDAAHHLEIHHIVHWDDHGTTDTWNLVALCPHHHRLHHRGRLGIAGNADDPDGVTFTDSTGRTITRSGARPKPPGARPPNITGTWKHPLGERLNTWWLDLRPPPTGPSRRQAS